MKNHVLKRKLWNQNHLTDRLGGKDAWRPTYFSYTGLFLHFPNKLCYGYLRFEWKNSFGKVGKKVCPVGFLSLVLLNWDSQQGRPFSLPSQRNFPISFKPKVAIAEFFWKMQRKTWYSILGLDAMPLSLKNLLLNVFLPVNQQNWRIISEITVV